MQLPIVLKQTASELPRLATVPSRGWSSPRNGVFVERRGPMYATSTRLRPDRHPVGGPQPVLHARRAANCPPPMHRVMLSFFLHAHRIHGGEAALVLLFHPERRRYLWHCPEQTVDMHQHHDGWYVEEPSNSTIRWICRRDTCTWAMRICTRTRPTPAHWTVQDDQDGLHIIVGNITRTPEYHIDFVMDGVRFQLTRRTVLRRSRPRDRAPRAPRRGSTRSAFARMGRPRRPECSSGPRESAATKLKSVRGSRDRQHGRRGGYCNVEHNE